jgi:hypothetical protein
MAKNALNKLFLDKVIKCPYFKYSSCGRQEKKKHNKGKYKERKLKALQ